MYLAIYEPEQLRKSLRSHAVAVHPWKTLRISSDTMLSRSCRRVRPIARGDVAEKLKKALRDTNPQNCSILRSLQSRRRFWAESRHHGPAIHVYSFSLFSSGGVN